MISVDVVGIGAWSEFFPDWGALQQGLNGGPWADGHKLVPELLPATLRRRAPQTVKLAVEVMHQATSMAGLEADSVGVVFASSMSDMQTTDRICHTLAEHPELISPTQFHNSVHNAATGYWSIITKSHEPANAICAHDHSPFMALLEAAIQCADENQPMLVVSQEVEAPLPFSSICANRNPCAAALLISPEGPGEDALARLQLEVIDEAVSWPDLPEPLQDRLTPSSGANLLALLAAIGSTDTKPMQFPLTPHSSLRVWITEHV